MTFRSYEKTIEDITEDHKKKLCLIQSRKNKIIHNWE